MTSTPDNLPLDSFSLMKTSSPLKKYLKPPSQTFYKPLNFFPICALQFRHNLPNRLVPMSFCSLPLYLQNELFPKVLASKIIPTFFYGLLKMEVRSSLTIE